MPLTVSKWPDPMAGGKSLQGYRPPGGLQVAKSRWLDILRRTWVWPSLLLLLLITASRAQVTTTITPDPTLGTAVTQDGTVYKITDGTRPGEGPNLFHSFDRFDVGTGDTAHFVGKTGIDNIIGRVTGPEVSMIDGTLQSDASLYLLNPQGIMFGPNAMLNINGSFHASTAHVLRFADGAEFSTRLSEKSTLTVASPSAFGFLNANPASITIEGSDLEVQEGETLSIVGGNITIKRAPGFFNDPANLVAPSGHINLVGVASEGDVTFDPQGQMLELDIGSFDQLGDVAIVGNAHIDVNGEGGGTIVIRGGQLLIDQSFVSAEITGTGTQAGATGTVEVSATDITIANGAALSTTSRGSGPSGNITVTATNSLAVTGRVTISASTVDGAGGQVVVTASMLLLEGGGNIQAQTLGDGDAGDIVVEAEQITIRDGGGISSTSGFVNQLTGIAMVGTGDAGNISVTARDIDISGGGNIQAQTLGDGDAGDIVVEAEQITIRDGGAIGSTSGFVNPDRDIEVVGTGDAGNISVTAVDIDISGGVIIASTFGDGHAGDIRITTDDLTITGIGGIGSTSGFVDPDRNIEVVGTGDAGNIIVTATNSLAITGGGTITSSTVDGAGGKVMITASTLLLEGGGNIQARTLGDGDAGDIIVEADQITLRDGGVISSNSGFVDPGSGLEVVGDGDAGDIMVTATDIDISGGGGISSNTFGVGQGGNVVVRATGTITLQGGITIMGRTFVSGIFAETAGTGELAGAAGTVEVSATNITIRDGAVISSSSRGAGQGGNVVVRATGTITLQGGITILGRTAPSGIGANAQGIVELAGAAGTVEVSATNIVILDGATISSIAFGNGDAGNITVTATNSLTVTSRGAISASTVDGAGGKVVVTASALILEEGGNIQAQTVGDGAAGDIVVQADEITLRAGGSISSASGFVDSSQYIELVGTGDAGNITVIATDINISGGSVIASTIGDGDAGNVIIQVERLAMSKGAQIESTSGFLQQGDVFVGKGSAGRVRVIATDAITIIGDGEAGLVETGLFSQTLAPTSEIAEQENNEAGLIFISTPRLTIENGGRIGADTGSDSRGGDIQINVGTLILAGGARISSGSGIEVDDHLFVGEGQGGNIVITATDIVVITGVSATP